MDQVHALDAALNQDVLKARFRLLSDYDSFADGMHTLRQVTGSLVTMPAFVPAASQAVFRAKVTEFGQLIGQKEQLLETFKSENAVLNNSLRYLPLASTELLADLANEPEDRRLETHLHNLMREVLVYCLNPGEGQTPAIRETLAKVAAWRLENPTHPNAALVRGVAAHAASIVALKPKIEALTQERPSSSRMKTSRSASMRRRRCARRMRSSASRAG